MTIVNQLCMKWSDVILLEQIELPVKLLDHFSRVIKATSINVTELPGVSFRSDRVIGYHVWIAESTLTLYVMVSNTIGMVPRIVLSYSETIYHTVIVKSWVKHLMSNHRRTVRNLWKGSFFLSLLRDALVFFGFRFVMLTVSATHCVHFEHCVHLVTGCQLEHCAHLVMSAVSHCLPCHIQCTSCDGNRSFRMPGCVAVYILRWLAAVFLLACFTPILTLHTCLYPPKCLLRKSVRW